MLKILKHQTLFARNVQIVASQISPNHRFDVIVIGGGHAGCEGAAAAARCGANVLLITHKVSTIGAMSCNPSFGGIGKGHLMRELDAMDGVSARICDKSAITYQALNRSHGPAVLGLRAQIDRKLYLNHMQDEILSKTPNLKVMEAAVEDLIIKEDITTNVDGSAEIYRGLESTPAGRLGEPASYGLSQTFRRLGFKLGRLRTGTPPRLHAKSIDFSQFELAPPDAKPIPFSYLTEKVWIPADKQKPTYFGYTNQRVAELIQANLHRDAHGFGGVTGPRYCPSLVTKVIRFPKLNHRFFLEYEGLDSDVIYMQGSTLTLEPDVQVQIIRSIKGFEKAEITQFGYGVHYDFINPRQIHNWLETKPVEGLFLAGQINGTTGYEEAATQGLLAGINCVRRSKVRRNLVTDLEPLTICRSEAYLGVMVDDLTNFGVVEPYRMFTSRVEFRLHLRPDNADLRLTEKAHKYGAVGQHRWERFSQVKKDFELLRDTLQSISMALSQWSRRYELKGFKLPTSGRQFTAYDIMHRFKIPLLDLVDSSPELKSVSHLVGNEDIEERVRLDGMYSLQHDRLMKQMQEMRREMLAELPESLDYRNMESLSLECREKLDSLKPLNLAAASRIEGITPEALITLMRFVKKGSMEANA